MLYSEFADIWNMQREGYECPSIRMYNDVIEPIYMDGNHDDVEKKAFVAWVFNNMAELANKALQRAKEERRDAEDVFRRRIAKLSQDLSHSDQRESYLEQKLAEMAERLERAETKLEKVAQVMRTF